MFPWNNDCGYIEVSNRNNVPKMFLKKNLAKLKKEGELKRIGPDKGGYWEIVER